MPIGNKFSNEIFSLSTQHRINKCNELINAIFLVSLFTLSKQSLEAEPSGVCLHRSHPWANPRFSLQSPYLLQHQSRAQELQSLLETSTYNLILVSFIFQGSCFYFFFDLCEGLPFTLTQQFFLEDWIYMFYPTI